MEKHYPIINILQKVLIVVLILVSIFKLYQNFQVEYIQYDLEGNIAKILEKNIYFYEVENTRQRLNAQYLTLRRPDDAILVKWVDTSAFQLQETIKQLNKTTNNSSRDTFLLLDYYHQNCAILDSIDHPLIKDDEKEMVKNQMRKLSQN